VSELDPTIIQEIVKAIKHPWTTFHRTINTLGSVIVIVCGVFIGYESQINNKTAERNTNQLELLNRYYVIQNQQTILLKIIDQNLRDDKSSSLGSAPLEEKVATAKIMYDLSITKRVPLSLLCGIAQTESYWNTHAVSLMGCVGLIQPNPLYARPYLRENRIDYKKDIYFDPVINCTVGIGMLNDFQNEKIEKGLATPDNWNFATHDYLWGPATRGNIYDMNYSLKVITAMKEFQKMGLI
jgi:hypothetical protein